jgi:cytochrome P450
MSIRRAAGAGVPAQEVPPIDVFDEGFQRDPYPAFARARSVGPIARDTFGNLVVLHIEDYEAVSTDPRFRSYGDSLPIMLGATSGPTYDWLAGSLLFLDPPDHTRIRGLVRREFTPRRLAALRPTIAATTDRLLDAVAAAGQMEVIGDFASQLPLLTICRLMGMPTQDWRLLRDWSARLLPNHPREVPASDQAVSEFRDYLAQLIRDRRRNGGDDLVSALVAAEHDDELCHDELWVMLMLLVFAGNDTTMGLLANAVYLLLTHPEQAAVLAADPDERIAAAGEEFLRFEPPVSGNGRIAREDLVLRDVEIEAGQIVRLMPTAVNRDPRRFVDPDRFDITRSPNRHGAFGYGMHLCLGATLARLEAQVALPRLWERLDGLALAGDGIRWAPTRGRTLESLPVRFSP